MTKSYVSAVFDTQDEAERAVSELRHAGISSSDISLIAQRDGKHETTDGAGEATATDFIGKTALGAGVGTALGVAALAIPGVGPLVAAGAIASAAIPGAALTGAAIGVAAGGIGAALSQHDVNDDDARYYEDRIGSGGVFVSAELSNANMNAETAQDILYRAGGHSSSREKMNMTS